MACRIHVVIYWILSDLIFLADLNCCSCFVIFFVMPCMVWTMSVNVLHCLRHTFSLTVPSIPAVPVYPQASVPSIHADSIPAVYSKILASKTALPVTLLHQPKFWTWRGLKRMCGTLTRNFHPTDCPISPPLHNCVFLEKLCIILDKLSFIFYLLS